MSSIVNDSFALERTYPVAPERVFAAWTTSEAKRQWFGADDGLDAVDALTLDFRVGGFEHFSARAGGSQYDFAATYHDIVPGERIVWTYAMQVDGRNMSVSLASVEITGVSGGTRLVLTEQGAYLDGLDTNAQRREGTEEFLEALGRYLAAAA